MLITIPKYVKSKGGWIEYHIYVDSEFQGTGFCTGNVTGYLIEMSRLRNAKSNIHVVLMLESQKPEISISSIS